MKDLFKALKAHYPVKNLTVQRDDLAFIDVPRESLRAVLMDLRAHHGFTHLVLLTAVDWLEDGQFQLTYLLHDRATPRDVGLRVYISRDGEAMDGIHDLWPTAATYQRELKEMFGIDFPGSPRVDEEFILEGWTHMPPYRRDFDTKEFSDKQFAHRPGRETRDPASYMKEQLYPDGEAK